MPDFRQIRHFQVGRKTGMLRKPARNRGRVDGVRNGSRGYNALFGAAYSSPSGPDLVLRARPAYPLRGQDARGERWANRFVRDGVVRESGFAAS